MIGRGFMLLCLLSYDGGTPSTGLEPASTLYRGSNRVLRTGHIRRRRALDPRGADCLPRSGRSGLDVGVKKSRPSHRKVRRGLSRRGCVSTVEFSTGDPVGRGRGTYASVKKCWRTTENRPLREGGGRCVARDARYPSHPTEPFPRDCRPRRYASAHMGRQPIDTACAVVERMACHMLNTGMAPWLWTPVVALHQRRRAVR